MKTKEIELSIKETEEISRILRNWIFPTSSDKNWEACKEAWIKDVSTNLISNLRKNGYNIVKTKC